MYSVRCTPITARSIVLWTIARGARTVVEIRASAQRAGLPLSKSIAHLTVIRLAASGLISATGQTVTHRSGRPGQAYALTASGKDLAAQQREQVRVLYGFTPTPPI